MPAWVNSDHLTLLALVAMLGAGLSYWLASRTPAGLWLAIGHVCSAVACCVTIIGIPFGWQHLKLAGIALAPIGKTLVNTDVAAASRRINAEASVFRMRGA